MTGSIAQRLLWKEYRVQRRLWLALAIGTVVLHGLIRAMIDDPGEAAEVFYWMAAILAFCYAVGGAAITFATEREDGTHLRLMTLAPPPVLTLTVKLMFVVLATILLCAATGLSAWLVSWSGFREPKLHGDLMDWLLRFAMWLVVGITCGMLFSLLMRHVFAALLGGAVVSLVMMGFVLAIWEEHGRRFRAFPEEMTAQRFWEFVAINGCILLGLCFVMGINLLLARRWFHRMFLDDAPSRIRLWFGQTRVRRSSVEGGITVEFGMQSDLTAPVLTPAEAAIQPSPRVSFSWLYHTQGTRSLRPFRFLRWKEIAETRLVFLLTCGVVVLLSAISLPSHWGSNATPIHYMLLIGLPALAGVLTFRSEQRHERFHFLANQGLSPRSIWFSKHSVWFPRVAGVVLLVVATTALMAARNGSVAGVAQGVFTLGFSDEEWRARFSTLAVTWLGENAVMRGAIIILTMYSLGQAASLTYKRGVVAVFAALLGVIITLLWVTLCTVGGVPLVLALLPVVPGLLLYTYFRTNSWLLERTATRTWLLPGTILTTSVIACFSLAVLYRVIEIPSVPAVQSEFGLSADDRAQLQAPITADERETADLYRQAISSIVGKTPDVFGFSGDGKSVTEETRQWVAINARSLEILRKAAARPSYAFKRADEFNVIEPPLSNAFWLILLAATHETADGHIEDALQSFESALTVSRHGAGRGDTTNSKYAIDRGQVVLTSLTHWATRPEVDAPLIERATQIINEYLAAVPGPGVAVFGTHQRLRSIVAAGPETIREYAGADMRLDNDPVLSGLYRFPRESLRMRRIVDWSDHRYSQLIAEFEAHGSARASGGMGAAYRLLNSRSRDAGLQLARWSKTTPSLRRLHEHWNVRDAATGVKLRTKAAATILTMHLLLAERRDGMLPESLDGIQVELKDPWTGKPFVWYPQGVPQKVTSGYVTIPPDQPFLLSAGPDNARIERIEYEVFPVDAMGVGGMMESGMGGQGAATPRFPTAIGGAPAQPQPADNPAPDDDADAPDSKVTTVVEYVIRQQHSGYGTGPSIFFIPRPEQESQPE